jgi:hypothetical protein
MLLKRRLQFFAIGGLRHFGQRCQDLLLREIDVFQRVMKQLIELLRFFRHRDFSLSELVRLKPARPHL